MSKTALQVCALILSLAGMTSVLVSTVSSKWKTSSSTGSIITSTSTFEGLWMHCVTNAMGSVQCKKFSSIFSLTKGQDSKISRHLSCFQDITGLFFRYSF